MRKNAKSYEGYIRNKRLFIIFMVILAGVLSVVSIMMGAAGLSPEEMMDTFMGNGTMKSKTILFSLRLPRIVTALVCGFGLGASGCVMQSILRNPLAEPSTVGVSQGAACGAAFAIIVLGGGTQTSTAESIISVCNPYIVSLCAFVGSMISTVVILIISRFKSMGPGVLILMGVALGSLFSAATTLMEYFADDIKVAAVVYWTFGSLTGTFWRDIIGITIVVVLAFIYFFLNRWNYNVMMSGEETAKSLGVNTESLLFVGMLICSLTTAVIVSNIGIIGFIGLIAPHLVRRIIGSDHRFLLPASGVAGSLLLLLGDTAARNLIAPVELPIGAITALFGAPIFMAIIFREVKNA